LKLYSEVKYCSILNEVKCHIGDDLPRQSLDWRKNTNKLTYNEEQHKKLNNQENH